jgi:hypothetical protein
MINRVALTLLSALVVLSGARADSFTFDLNATGHLQFPAWMPERPVALPNQHAELSFPVVPIEQDDDLALTVVFNDLAAGYLSVLWENIDGRREMLAPNLFENIGLPDQRTLLISRPTMGGPGRVILQSSESILNVVRVRLDWVRPGVVRLTDNQPNGALITSGGKLLAPEEVDGTPLTPIADSWEDIILTTSVTERAERLDHGIDFQVNVPRKVNRARIDVMVNGLQLDQSLGLWLNGNRVGSLSMEVPDLTDPGFDRHANAANDQRFTGWRRGVLYLVGERLPVGNNHFQFLGPTGVPLAIRDFLLQVDYAPF